VIPELLTQDKQQRMGFLADALFAFDRENQEKSMFQLKTCLL
jgi:hypothetical protein